MPIPKEPLVEALLAIQALETMSGTQDPSAAVQLEKLRDSLPVSILIHHDHRRQRGKLSITTVSPTGVCGHCHLAVPRGLLLQMSRSGALGTCPHCEGFLYLDSESTAAILVKKSATKKSKAVRRSTTQA